RPFRKPTDMRYPHPARKPRCAVLSGVPPSNTGSVVTAGAADRVARPAVSGANRTASPIAIPPTAIRRPERRGCARRRPGSPAGAAEVALAQPPESQTGPDTRPFAPDALIRRPKAPGGPPRPWRRPRRTRHAKRPDVPGAGPATAPGTASGTPGQPATACGSPVSRRGIAATRPAVYGWRGRWNT